MSTLLKPTIQVLDKNPEVKSFIYQMISEFDQFVTPQTIVTVTAKDPRKLALQYEAEGKIISHQELRRLYRISIELNEGDAKAEAEGVHEDIFQAIKIAKDNLLLQLIAIQDSVVSQQDRLIEINHYLQPMVVH
jgi:hypothetical protein